MVQRAEQKEETRKKILAAASRSFRKNGYAGIGVDGLSKAAGVTSGAFYKHFGSKEAAFRQAVRAGLDEVLEAAPRFQNDHGEKWLEAFVDYYLGKPHREDREGGCAMTTLSPEVVREDDALRAEFEGGMQEIVEAIARGLEGGDAQARQSKAWGLLSTLIGGLTFARAMASEDAAEQVAAAAKDAALAIARG